MKLNYLFLCDHAFQSEGGKLNLIGIFKNINIRKFPGGVPKFSLVGGLEVPASVFRKVELEAVLIGPDKKKIPFGMSTLRATLPKREETAPFELAFNIEVVGLKFKKEGKYQFLIRFNQQNVGKINFEVLQYPQKKE